MLRVVNYSWNPEISSMLKGLAYVGADKTHVHPGHWAAQVLTVIDLGT